MILIRWFPYLVIVDVSFFNAICEFLLQMGQFYVAAKAFDVLERLDPNPEYWEGKRGSCVGLFQAIIAGHEPKFVFMFKRNDVPV